MKSAEVARHAWLLKGKLRGRKEGEFVYLLSIHLFFPGAPAVRQRSCLFLSLNLYVALFLGLGRMRLFSVRFEIWRFG